jgi:streptogramin lyase
VSGDGGRLAVDAAVYDRDFNLLATVSLPEPGVSAVAVSPDGGALYTLAQAQNPTTSAWYWTLRRTAIGGTPPYTADATALQFAIASDESPYAMAVSEDGSTLFLVTHTVSSSVTTTAVTFRAFPLR